MGLLNWIRGLRERRRARIAKEDRAMAKAWHEGRSMQTPHLRDPDQIPMDRQFRDQ